MSSLRSRRATVAVGVALALAALSPAHAQSAGTRLRIAVTLPATIPGGIPGGATGLDGRLVVVFSADSSAEPRFQVGYGVSTQPAFAIDVTDWKPGDTRVIDASAFGLSLIHI